ncbi:CARDB domain-containing protein [Sorangium sp. So ce1153]|uniref:CARDB domain-containing protein n=1 Tax=Sorangium sp. So ce1153 TaxID=3133333 RepID=UPI003F601F32
MQQMLIRTAVIVTVLAVSAGGCAVDPVGLDGNEEPLEQATQTVDTPLPDVVVQSFTVVDVSGGVQMTAVIKNQGAASVTSTEWMAVVSHRKPVSPLQPTNCTLYGGTWAPNTGPLAAGASRTFSYTITGWTVSAMESCIGTWYSKTDWANQITESDESNNIKYGKD